MKTLAKQNVPVDESGTTSEADAIAGAVYLVGLGLI
jgi:hypothetical protein